MTVVNILFFQYHQIKIIITKKKIKIKITQPNNEYLNTI